MGIGYWGLGQSPLKYYKLNFKKINAYFLIYMEECIAAAGENGKYQKIITFIGISLGSLPFTLSITYAYLTKIPKFLYHWRL